MGIYSINLGVFTKEDFAPSQALSTIVHVPSSFPLDVLISDPAIPSDAKMESSESDNDSSTPTCFVDVDLSKDDNMDSNYDYYKKVKDPQAAGDKGDTMSQPHNSQVGNNFLSQTNTWRAMVTHLDLTEFIYQY